MAFYPANWHKAACVLRRVVGKCELCGATQGLTVHHQGVPRPTGDGWRPGSAKDKRDLRRENLQVLCTRCHEEVDPARIRFHKMRNKRRAKLARHRALGIDTGLVVYAEGQVA